MPIRKWRRVDWKRALRHRLAFQRQSEKIQAYQKHLEQKLPKPKRKVRVAVYEQEQEPVKLGANAAKIILDHMPLLKSVARLCAPNSPEWRNELETYLLDKLVELWPQWDENRGVTFGAFAKRRLMGAGQKFIKHRHRATSMDPSYIDIATRDKTRKAPKQDSDDISNKYWSGGDRRTEGFIRGRSEPIVESTRQSKRPVDRKPASAQPITKKPPTLTDELNAALDKLNHRQRVVYTGMILTDPPVSRYRLALELGIRDITKISTIKR